MTLARAQLVAPVATYDIFIIVKCSYLLLQIIPPTFPDAQVSPMHVWDSETKRIVLQPALTWVPGLYKIFDEILVNAADNKRRDVRMNCLRVTVDSAEGRLSVWNNGECTKSSIGVV